MTIYRVMVLVFEKDRLYWRQVHEGTRYSCQKFAKAEHERAKAVLIARGFPGRPARYYVTRRTVEDFCEYHNNLHWGLHHGRSVGRRGG